MWKIMFLKNFLKTVNFITLIFSDFKSALLLLLINILCFCHCFLRFVSFNFLKRTVVNFVFAPKWTRFSSSLWITCFFFPHTEWLGSSHIDTEWRKSNHPVFSAIWNSWFGRESTYIPNCWSKFISMLDNAYLLSLLHINTLLFIISVSKITIL